MLTKDLFSLQNNRNPDTYFAFIQVLKTYYCSSNVKAPIKFTNVEMRMVALFEENFSKYELDKSNGYVNNKIPLIKLIKN